MRVAVLHDLPPGGARRVVAEHASRLDADVQEFCLSTATPVTNAPTIVPYAPRGDRARRWLRPPLRYAEFGELVRAWRKLAALMETGGFDVVLAHPCRYLQGPLGVVWTSAPVVYFCHEPRRVDYEPAAAQAVNTATRGLYGPLYQLQRLADRRATARADVLVTNSQYTAGQIEQAYGRSAAVVPLGVGEAFRPSSTTGPGRGHLLTVGALVASKGHDLVIEAASVAQVRRPVLLIAPRPDPTEERRLRDLARTRGVDLDVRIGITDAELVAAFQGAFATLYLAAREPYGLVSLEAQACGSPVIVSDEGGLPETIVAGRTGWAVTRDAASAARALDALEGMDHAALATRAAAHAGALTWDASADAMHAHLQSASE